MSDKAGSEQPVEEVEKSQQTEAASTETASAEPNVAPADDAAARARERQERFKALKSRAVRDQVP